MLSKHARWPERMQGRTKAFTLTLRVPQGDTQAGTSMQIFMMRRCWKSCNTCKPPIHTLQKIQASKVSRISRERYQKQKVR